MLQAQGTLILDVGVFDGVQPVPESESASDHHPDQKADHEKQAVSGKRDEQQCHHRNRYQERGRALHTKTEARTGSGRHTTGILAPLQCAESTS